MAARLLMISIYWSVTPMTMENVNKIDAILGAAGDWLRFSGSTWLLFTERGVTDIEAAIRTALTVEDHDIIAQVDPHAMTGWGPTWVDNWLLKYRDLLPRTT